MEDPRIIGLLQSVISSQREFERKILEEFADLRGEMIRLGGKMSGFEASCVLRHKGIDGEVAVVRANAEGLKKAAEATGLHQVDDLRAELRRRDEERKKWVFWAVTTFVSLLLGAGGVGAVVVQLLQRR